MEKLGEFLTVLCVSSLLVGALVVGILWFASSKDKGPTALVVYRGRTELIVTSKNGVTVDSVVIFKEDL